MPDYSRAGRPVAAVEAGMLTGLINVLGGVEFDAKLDAPTTWELYRCPAGKKVVITEVIAHSNTATLAGMSDVNIGGGVAAATPVYKDAADLSGMTSAGMLLRLGPSEGSIMIDGDDATLANRILMVEVVLGSTGDANVKLDVLGYLIDS